MYEIRVKHFWKEHLCALKVFLCALVSWPVCAHTRRPTAQIGHCPCLPSYTNVAAIAEGHGIKDVQRNTQIKIILLYQRRSQKKCCVVLDFLGLSIDFGHIF